MSEGSSGSVSPASSWLSSVTDYVYEASEKIYDALEEASNLIAGESKTASSGSSTGGGEMPSEQDGDMPPPPDDDFSSPLDGITEGVLGDIMKNQAGPSNVREQVDAFRSAITWDEPFITALVIFIALMFVATIFAIRRNSLRFRMVMFTILAVTIRSAEYINIYLSKHWEQFGITQNYFDKGGIFVGIMICAPLLFLSVALLLSFLWEAKTLLIQVKKMELEQKKKAKKAAKQKQKSTGTTKTSAKNKHSKTTTKIQAKKED